MREGVLSCRIDRGRINKLILPFLGGGCPRSYTFSPQSRNRTDVAKRGSSSARHRLVDCNYTGFQKQPIELAASSHHPIVRGGGRYWLGGGAVAALRPLICLQDEDEGGGDRTTDFERTERNANVTKPPLCSFRSCVLSFPLFSPSNLHKASTATRSTRLQHPRSPAKSHHSFNHTSTRSVISK